MTSKKARYLTVIAAATAALALALGGVALCSAATGGAEVTDPTVGDRVGNNAPAPAEDTGAGESTVSAVVAAIVAVAVILLIIALMPRKKQDQT